MKGRYRNFKFMRSGIIIAVLLCISILVVILHPWRDQKGRGLNLTADQICPVVILPFETSRLGEDWQWLSIGMVDLFATKLNNHPPLKAVGLEQLLEEINPLSLHGGLIITAAEAVDLLNARTALGGRMAVENSGFQLEIKLLARDGDAVLLKKQLHVPSAEHLFTAVDSLGTELIAALDWITPPQVLSVTPASPSSLTAYHHYVMAVEDYIISDETSLPRAADHLALAVAADSGFARAHFLRAKVSDQAQALDIPLEFPEEALILALRFPQRLPEWERLYALGWKLWLVDGDLDEAVAVLQNLSEIHPDYAWQEGLPLTLGRLLAHQGQWQEAISQLEGYVQSPTSPVLRRIIGWGQLATAYQLTGDLEGAIQAMEEELSLQTDDQGNRHWWIGENLSLALLYFERGESARQEEVMQEVQESVANDPRGLAMIGQARFRMQQVNRAEILAERALRQSDDLPAGHYLRGLLSLKRKRYWQAVADLEAACTQEFNWDYLYHAALAHAKRGNKQSADEIFELLVDVLGGTDPPQVAAADLGTLGILMSRLGQNEAALTVGMAAIERHPYPQSKYDLAAIYTVQGDQSSGMGWLRQAFAEGYVGRRQSRADFDFENLWYEPNFILLTSGN